MKIKKLYPIGVALSIAATIGFGNLASAVGTEYISFEYREQGSTETIKCYFFDSDGISQGGQCESSFGVYNSGQNILNLGADVDDKPNGRLMIKGASLSGISITADTDMRTNIYAFNQDIEIKLNFSTHSFTDTLFKYNDSSEGVYSEFGEGNHLVIENGTINNVSLDVASLRVEDGVVNVRPKTYIYGDIVVDGGTINNAQIIASSLEVNGGVINALPDAIIAIQARSVKESSGDINILGGEINIPSCDIAFNIGSDGGNINISGGTINANNIRTSGFSIHGGGLNISGGEINMKSAQDPAGFGILLSKDIDLTIDDGDLTLDGFDWGISGANSKIYFNGGTTIIKNSKKHTIWIDPATDPEHDIVFGEGMGIKEDTYVFWDDKESNSSTGIADPNIVTITEGYKVRRHKGWESINDDSIKVPDTGAFSNMDDKTTVILTSLGALAIVSGLAYLIIYAVKRLSVRAKFNK